MSGSTTLHIGGFQCEWRMVRHRSGPYSHFGGMEVVAALWDGLDGGG
jgi:hypothetical protein